MPYARLTCYFLSGTGNSFRAARWLVEAAEAGGVASAVIPIERANPAEDLAAGPSQLVGIYHPAHGLMPPWSMIKFVLRLPRGRGAHAVVLATRGGIRVGPIVLPGAAGLGIFFPVLVLMLKGYRVRGGFSIDMPINLINVHWGLAPHNADHIREWGRRRHARLVEAVLAGRRFWRPLNLLWEALWAGAAFWLWPTFPLGYLVAGRISMGKIMFSDTRCRGCGLCAKFCPNHAIVMTGGKPKRPFWTYHCEACLRCMGYCPAHAVEASHAWLAVVICATLWLTAEPLGRAATALVGRSVVLPHVAWEVLGILLTFFVVVALYRIFFLLLRVRPLRVAASYLTFTRYYSRRFHDRDTLVKHLR